MGLRPGFLPVQRIGPKMLIAILFGLRSAGIKSASTRWTRVGYGLLLLYVVIAFLLRNTQTFFDEGSNLNLASSMLQGRHLYRDLFENHFPFPVYLSAALIFFTGASLPLVRLAVLFMDAAMLLATMRVSGLYFPVGFAAAVWAFISPYYFGNMLLYDNLAMLGGIALGAVCFAALARGLEPSRSMFVLLAIAGFVASMSNPFFVLVTFIAIGALWFAPRIPVAFVVKLALTIAVPMVAYFAYLAATGGLRSFYAYAIVFNTTTYQKYASLEILPSIRDQLLLFDIFNPKWLESFDPLRFDPITFSPVFDNWIFSGLFYRLAALAACAFFALRREYRIAVFLYLFVAALPLRGDDLFHAAPFVLFCLFLVGVLIQESVGLPQSRKVGKVALLAFCGVPTLVLASSGARYVVRHAMQSDFGRLTAETRYIKEAAQNHNDVQLGHYPDGNYMYYLTGFRPLSKFVDFYPWVAEIGRPEVDADLKRAARVVLVLDLTGNVWTYPNYITLDSELDYARKNLVKERFGWLTVWVSPCLAAKGNSGTEADFSELGVPFSDAPAEIKGGWTKDGYPPGTGGPPVQGQVFGSFSGADSNTGTLRLGPFSLSKQGEMAIPLLTGLDDHHLSVIVRDAASRKVLAQMDHPPPIYATWWAWHPKLPHDAAMTVEVIAEDKGSDAGEWMALGWPHILRQRKTGPPFKPGLYRDGEWRLASDIENVQGPATRVYHYGGKPGDVPVTGDWDGSGETKIGIYRPALGQWMLDYNGNGVPDPGDKIYHFGGQPGDVPVTGDWDGSGRTKIGIYRPSTGEWLLDYNGDGTFNAAQDRKYKFGGLPGDRPVVGDWTGTGVSNIGVVRQDYRWILDSNGNGQLEESADATFYFGGIPGDILVTGDWSGDGRTKPGIFRRGHQWLFDVDGNYRFDDAGSSKDVAFSFGSPGEQPITGAW